MSDVTKEKVKKKKKFSAEHRKNLSISKVGIKNPMYGKKLSDERKLKIALESAKRWANDEYKKMIGKRISESKIGHPVSLETRKKLRASQIGKHISNETRKKMSESKKGKNTGVNNPMYGKRLDKCPNWKGGKSFEKYTTDWTDELKDIIRERDGYICYICGTHQDELNGFNQKLDVHHIDYDKQNCNPENLISLCRSCHVKTNYNREYWLNYFNINI